MISSTAWSRCHSSEALKNFVQLLVIIIRAKKLHTLHLLYLVSPIFVATGIVSTNSPSHSSAILTFLPLYQFVISSFATFFSDRYTSFIYYSSIVFIHVSLLMSLMSSLLRLHRPTFHPSLLLRLMGFPCFILSLQTLTVTSSLISVFS